MAECLVCKSNQTETVLDLGRQPVSSHFTASPGETLVRHELQLSLCRSCGVIQLSRPYPFRDLIPPYEWISYREPESHLDLVADRIFRLPGLKTNGSAAGLSFKDTTLLERLAKGGLSQTWSLDPREDLGADNPNANIESVPGLLTPDKAAKIAKRNGPADLLVARHILEHAETPWRFMEALGRMIKPGGYLVIEVPDCRANLERQDYSMIWEEHTLYFTPETISQILASAGCIMTGIEVHPFAFEDVIVLYARKEEAGGSDKTPADTAAIERNTALARNYGAAFPGWTERYRNLLERLTQDGRKVAAYGAGHLTCAFINFHDLSKYFAFVVDDTPHKQDLRLPGCGLPIVANSELTAEKVSACFFGLAPEIEDKVIANNPLYAQKGGVFYSMFVDSKRSIRTLVDA